MINSLLGKIIELRNAFCDSSERQDLGLSALTGIVDTNDLPSITTISDGLGNVLNIEVDEWYININTVVVKGAESARRLYRCEASELQDIDTDTLWLDEVNEDLSLTDFINNAAAAKADNDLLSAVLSKFTTSSKIKATDIYAIIESSALPLGEAMQFKQAITQITDDEGRVSNYQFLQLIRNFSEETKKVPDAGGISLDTSEVFYLKNFLGTAVLQLISTIATLAGILVTMLNRVVGIIVAGLGMILSKIHDVFSQYLPSTHLKITNPLSATYYFEGAMSAIMTNDITTGGNPGVYDDLSELKGSGKLWSVGSFDSYLWTDGSHLYLNELFGIGIHPGRMLTWLQDTIQVTSVGSNEYNYRNFLSARWPLDDVMMTQDEIAELLSGSTKDIEANLFTQLILTLMLLIPNQQSVTVKLDPNLLANPGWIFSGNSSGMSDMGKLITMTCMCYSLLVGNGADYFKTLATFNFDWATQLALIYRKYTNSLNYFLSLTPYDETGTVTVSTPVAMTFYLSVNGLMRDTVTSTMFDVTTGEPHYVKGSGTKIDSISDERMFQFNSTTEAAIISAFALIATVATTALIGGIIISKQVKKFSWKRQQQRQNELIKMKNNLLDEDNPPTPQDYDEFYKAQKKYNFRAKIFGWDSYDAGNSWFDSSSSGSYSGGNVDLKPVTSLIKS